MQKIVLSLILSFTLLGQANASCNPEADSYKSNKAGADMEIFGPINIENFYSDNILKLGGEQDWILLDEPTYRWIEASPHKNNQKDKLYFVRHFHTSASSKQRELIQRMFVFAKGECIVSARNYSVE